MTTSRDSDRILRAWLELMPDEAPDRVVDSVLQAVETTPQARRPLRWPTWRSPAMNRLAIALGAAALVVAAGAILLPRTGAPPSVGASPSRSAPSASPSPFGASPGAAVPSELTGRWMGDHRTAVAPDAGTSILFDTTSIAVSQANENGRVLARSTASAVDAGRIQLVSAATTGGCTRDDVGTYTWARSESGRVLTITTEQDDCAARAETVAGVWWRMQCPDTTNNCLGPLDAGQYPSQFIAPRLDPGATWTPNVGALAYTVPDGWANSADWPERFDLVPVAEMAPIAEADRTRQIGLVTQPTAMAQDKPCSDEAAPGVGRSVDALATWLRTVPGLRSSNPVAITIDGHQGKWLDLEVDVDWKRACPPDETRPIIAYLNPGVAISNVERERLFLIDLGGGDVLAVVFWAHDQAAFDTHLPEATSIIESFQFE